MLISQVTTWMPTVHCDSCGKEIPTEDAIPHINGNSLYSKGRYELSFYCSKNCYVIGKDLTLVARDCNKN